MQGKPSPPIHSQQVLNELNHRQQSYRQNYYGRRGSNDDMCDLCCKLYMLDTCCECMGGDGLPCI